MKTSCLKHFSSSKFQESKGISSAERSFRFKAIQFNLPHLNSTLRDQSDKRIVQDTLGYTQIKHKSSASRKQTSKNIGHKGGNFLGISSRIKVKIYTYDKYIEISRFVRLAQSHLYHL